MAKPMSRPSKLTPEQRKELHAEIRKGPPINRKALSEKYGISEAGVGYHTGLVNGKQPPSRANKNGKARVAPPAIVINTPEQALEAMNADILSGNFTLDAIAEKYGISKSKVWERKKKLGRVHSASALVVMDKEQIGRAVQMLGRVAERKPEVFTDLMGIMSKKYPTLWIEVL